MYPNLNAEMARNNVSQKDIALYLNKDESTISYKSSGKSDWFLKECKAINEHFFPNLTIDYLFATKEEINNEEE